MRLVCSLWTRKPNTAARGGAFLGWMPEENCTAACLKSTSCVAADSGPLGCLLHHDADDLTTTFYVKGVTQFVLNRECTTTTPLLTTTPISTATETFKRSTGINSTETLLNFAGLQLLATLATDFLR